MALKQPFSLWNFVPPSTPGLRIYFFCKVTAVILFILGYQNAALLFFFGPDPWLLVQVFVPTAKGLGCTVTRFRTSQKEVWLTIDDGPDPATTPHVLAALASHGARATFFLIGEKATCHPELVTEIVRQGHTVANHTHRHACGSFWCASPRRIGEELDRCSAALRAAGVEPAPWFRAPVGLKNLLLYRQLAQRGLTLVHWSARGFDTRKGPPQRVMERIARQLSPGAIILLHENRHATEPGPAAIALLLEHLKKNGYTCVIPPAESLIG